MNPLTQVKNLQKINATEARLGISEDASWHSKYKHSAYVYAGGLEFSLTEGDIVAVFAQCGEVVDVHLVRDKATGKSKGFAFVAYEDQRSTNLAVDNLNGATVAGRTIKVDHVERYKKLEEEDEEEAQRKREERGVCRAFQRGECTRGDACRFSHNEKRAANTGWGAEDKKWGHDNYDGPRKYDNRSGPPNRVPEPRGRENLSTRDKFKGGERRSSEEDKRMSRRRGEEDDKLGERSREDYKRRDEKRPRRHDENDKLGPRSREDYDRRDEKRSRRHDDYDNGREYHGRRDDGRPRRQGDDEVELKPKSGEDNRPRGGGTDVTSETKFTEDQVRKNYDKREDSKPRRRDDDFEAYVKKEDRDQMEEKRSRRPNHDEEEANSRASRDRREGERSRRYHDYEVPPKSTEVRQGRD